MKIIELWRLRFKRYAEAIGDADLSFNLRLLHVIGVIFFYQQAASTDGLGTRPVFFWVD